MFTLQEEYRDKRNKYLSRSESLLFDLYDETADDSDFALYIDRASTPVDGRSLSTRSVSTSRGSSVTRSGGHLRPPDAGDPVQRSSSCAGEGRPSTEVVEGAGGGRLPRPRSAIVTRESAMDQSTSSPLLSTARDDVVTTAPANLLTVPSSWYRTEVATNVGQGSRRLTANVQLGLPPPVTTTSTTSTTVSTAEVSYLKFSTTEVKKTLRVFKQIFLV